MFFKCTCRVIAFVLLAGLLHGPAGATDKCGAVCDEVWDLAGSPYVVTCDVTVAAACSLDIDAGVMVRFQSATGLVVDGDLTVAGTTGSVPVFTADAATPTRGSWDAIEVRSGATASIAGADIAWASNGIVGTSATLVISDSTIRESSTSGVQASGGTLDMTGSTLTGNGSYGLYATGGVAYTLNGVEASGGSYGLYADGASVGTLTDVTLQSNSYGMYVYANNSGTTTVDVSASSITGNSRGVWAQGVNSAAWTNPEITVSGSSLYGNSQYDYYTTGFYEADTSVLAAGGNWWGTTDASAIAAKVWDHKNSTGSPTVDWCQYQDAPAPGGVLAHNDLCPDLLACDESVAWNATDQSYLLTSTMIVCPTGTLDLGPGVTVRGASAATAIQVAGTLNVNGTDVAPVSLTSATDTPARGDWGGLQFVAGSVGSIAGADIAWASNGIVGTSATLVISDSTIRESSTSGVQASGGTLNMTGSTLTGNGSYGLYATGGVDYTLNGVEATGGSYGLYADGASVGTLTDVTLQSNSYGMYVYANNSGTTTVDVSASSITGNSRGVWAQGVNSAAWTNPEITVSGSSLYGNSQYDYYTTGFYEADTSVLAAGGNWWGTTDASAIAAKVWDHKNSTGSPTVDWCQYQDAPAPGGVLAHNDLCPDLLACDESVAWNATDQSYLLTSTMIVCPTGTLDLGPGVSVRAASAATAIKVAGTLNVNGTDVAPVSLTSNADTPARGDWGGLQFVAGSVGSIAGADIAWASNGIVGTSATLVISDSTIRESSSSGVQVSGGTLDMTGSMLTGNGSYGLYATGAAAYTLNGVEASGGSYGINADGASVGTLTDVTLQSNSYGMYVYANNSGTTTVDVSASSITGNSRGVWAQGVNSAAWTNPDITVSGSSLYGNSQYDYYTTGFYEADTSVLAAGGNWWGTTDASAIAAKVWDHKNSASSPTVDWCQYLDAPAPGGVLAHNDLCPDLLACDESVAWNATDQSYLLTSTMIVCPTGTLDLGPGVTVRGASAATAIQVAGTLNVNGADVATVSLTSNADTPARGDWGGLQFVAGSVGSIAGADIAWASNGIVGTSATLVISDSTIRESSTSGVQASGGTLDMTGSTLTGNGSYGLYATGAAAYTLNGVEASGGSYGLYADGASVGTLTDVTLQSNSYGMYVYANNSGTTTVDVSASSITGNSRGVWAQGVNSAAWTNPDITVSGSSLYGNSQYDYYTTGFYEAGTSVLAAGGNWWGTTDASAIGAKVWDHKNSVSSPTVDWCQYLDAPAPGGVLAHNDLCPDLLACDESVAWNATDQSYLLTSTMIVCPTGTLDLGPGVTVRGASAATAIQVAGTLNVNGTDVAPVSLTSNADTPARGDWGGLQFVAGSVGSIAGADIAWASNGIVGTSATLVISDSTIRESSTSGVQASGGTLDMTGSTLTGNGSYGLYATGAAAYTLNGVEASGGSYGLYADGASVGTLTDVTLQSNSYGMYVYANNSGTTTVDVSASSITGNSRGVWAQGVNSAAWTNPDITVSGSSLYGNSQYDYYTTGFYEAVTEELWATDNWWGTNDADQIAAAIYDRDDSASSPRVVTRASGSSCEVAIGQNFDNDVFGDFEDNCPLVANPDQADADGDGMGDACDPEPSAVPGGACNGIDDVTDGFVDADADGWGDPCDFQPLRADSYPGAPELCDARDNDGDLAFAEGEQVDADGDGAVACGDCAEDDPAVFPCACERCANLVDDDCDGATDGDDVACTESPYCVLLTAGSDPLELRLDKGACGGAEVAGPYDVIRGFTTNLGLSGSSVDLGNVACTSSGLGLDRITDVSEDVDPACNDGSVFWLARPSSEATFGADSSGQPRDVTNPDPPCP